MNHNLSMKPTLLIILFAFISLTGTSQNWPSIKSGIAPEVALNSEFGVPFAYSHATVGWEDGVHISEDGLKLFCTYVPIDLLSFALNGSLPNNYSQDYERGAPHFDMDFTTNPIGATEWLHSDILYATRSNTSEPFSGWVLTNMARTFYSEGAPTPVLPNSNQAFFLFTSNDNDGNHLDIRQIGVDSNDSQPEGEPLPAPITTSFNEDNPHIIMDENDDLILVFDSDNRPGGAGELDIWQSKSTDGGHSWTEPTPVTSINTSHTEHQPFLHFDLNKKQWFIYFAAHHTDGKLAIFRARQSQPNNWTDWIDKELVVSAGSAAGIGEPTLTTNGDLSFVVVYEDPEQNSEFDHFDSDPWYLPAKESSLSLKHAPLRASHFYPNPITDVLYLEVPSRVKIFNHLGQLIMETNSVAHEVSVGQLPLGLYILEQFINGDTVRSRLIKM